jgi:F0F1-type ATP synthase assembly protein I
LPIPRIFVDHNVPASNDRSPLSAAIEWVGRITAVGVEMVVPGLAGSWLDDRLGSTPLLTLVGFAFGMVAGIWHLLIMTSAKKSGDRPRRDNNQPPAPNDDLNRKV